MQITTRDQIQKDMIMYRVCVDSARETSIEKIVARSLPYKRHYGGNEFFMWAIDIDGPDTISVVDMGIDQIPQYNLHATFSTLEEANSYEDHVRIDYESLDENTIEFGGDVYVLDEKVDPNEVVPFTFDDCVVALTEMDLDWVAAVDEDDTTGELLSDYAEYEKTQEQDQTESAYERAMKGI